MKKLLVLVGAILLLSTGVSFADDDNLVLYMWHEGGPGERDFQFNNTVISIGMPIGLWRNIGYRDLSLGVSGGASVRVSSRFALDLSGNHFFRSIKRGPGDGTKSGAALGARFYLTERLFVGPFVSGLQQRTSRWRKEAVYVGGSIGGHFGNPNGHRLSLTSSTSYDVESFNRGLSTSLSLRMHYPLGRKFIGGRTLTATEQRERPGVDCYAITKDTWGIVAQAGVGLLNFRQQRNGAWGRENGVVVDYYVGLYWNIW